MERKRLICTIHDEVFGEGRPILVVHGGYLERRHIVDGVLLTVPGRYAVCSAESVPSHVILVKADELVPTLAPHENDQFERLVVQSREILEKIHLKNPCHSCWTTRLDGWIP